MYDGAADLTRGFTAAMTRQTPTLDDLKRQLALVGIEADEATLEAVQRRLEVSADAMQALDELDLGMADPAPVYKPDEE